MSTIKCRNGERNGRLVILYHYIKVTYKEPKRRKYYKALCDCGTYVDIDDRIRTRVASCGCLRSANLIGKQIGKLTVLSAPYIASSSISMCVCKCECGTERPFALWRVARGLTKSCGCMTHGANHHSYNTKLTIEERAARRSGTPHYRGWVQRVKANDNFTCVVCSSTHLVEAHHILPWKTFPAWRPDLTNGATLCLVCHKAIHGKWLRYRYDNLDELKKLRDEKGVDFERLGVFLRRIEDYTECGY